jgi:hypothetical protein
MTFNFIFEDEPSRLIPAILVDARANIPSISNAVGSVIKSYTDGEVGRLDDNSIVYKIERADIGVLCGYFVLNINPGTGAATLGSLVVRPAFQNMVTTISANIVNFITSGLWRTDFLF